MKENRRKLFALLVAVLMFGAAACGNNTVNKQPQNSTEGELNTDGNVQDRPGEDKTVTVTENKSEEVKATVILSDSGITVNGTGCDVRPDRLKIEEAGTYEISGTLSNGSIYVNVDNESEVHLILKGAKVHNETSAALFCKKAKKVTVTLQKDTVNEFSDGTAYVFEPEEDEPDATFFAKHDLVITGEGTLKVTANYGDAIKGKDSLYIHGGIIDVDAVDDGITGRDFLQINGGVITVRSESDAIKSSNDTDPAMGNIEINGGVLTVTGEGDDIQAENKVTINGGVLELSDGEDGIQSGTGTEINGGVISGTR